MIEYRACRCSWSCPCGWYSTCSLSLGRYPLGPSAGGWCFVKCRFCSLGCWRLIGRCGICLMCMCGLMCCFDGLFFPKGRMTWTLCMFGSSGCLVICFCFYACNPETCLCNFFVIFLMLTFPPFISSQKFLWITDLAWKMQKHLSPDAF